jgi:predicted metal-binding membrane protein
MSFGQEALQDASGVDRGLARAFRSGRAHGLVLLAALVAASWLHLAFMIADMLPGRDMGAFGPGMAIFNLVNGLGAMDDATRAFLAALCAVPGASHFGMPSAGAWGARDLALVALMWAAMSGAMMLPTVAPMVTTYAEVAATAARKRLPAAPLAVLVAGYVAVWLVFSAAATLAQWGATSALLLTPHMTLVSPVLAGALFLLAGAYQFTPLKHACLTRCRSPFPVLFSRWSERPAAMFRLGIDEGLACLGCCWALMTLMFAVGLMNVVWMGMLAAAMVAEKLTSTRRVPYAIGATLLLIGAGIWVSILVASGAPRL